MWLMMAKLLKTGYEPPYLNFWYSTGTFKIVLEEVWGGGCPHPIVNVYSLCSLKLTSLSTLVG